MNWVQFSFDVAVMANAVISEEKERGKSKIGGDGLTPLDYTTMLSVFGPPDE